MGDCEEGFESMVIAVYERICEVDGKLITTCFSLRAFACLNKN
jgi:hypothetical protein